MRALLLAVLLLSGCSDPAGPGYQVPSRAEEIEVPAIYWEWWDEVQQDAGIEGDLSRLRLFSMPYPWYNRRYGTSVQGLWVPDGRVYIVHDRLAREGLVKHELLHELLRGDRDHAHALFAVYDDPLYGLPPGE